MYLEPHLYFLNSLILQILREDQLERMRNMGVVANIQPSMLVTDCQWLEQRVPKELLKCSYAWKSLADKGLLKLLFGIMIVNKLCILHVTPSIYIMYLKSLTIKFCFFI